MILLKDYYQINYHLSKEYLSLFFFECLNVISQCLILSRIIKGVFKISIILFYCRNFNTYFEVKNIIPFFQDIAKNI